MFQPDISVIRAVQTDRIQRDITARMRPEVAASETRIVAAIRRSVGRSIVRIGSRIAAEPATEHALDLATSR